MAKTCKICGALPSTNYEYYENSKSYEYEVACCSEIHPVIAVTQFGEWGVDESQEEFEKVKSVAIGAWNKIMG